MKSSVSNYFYDRSGSTLKKLGEVDKRQKEKREARKICKEFSSLLIENCGYLYWMRQSYLICKTNYGFSVIYALNIAT